MLLRGAVALLLLSLFLLFDLCCFMCLFVFDALLCLCFVTFVFCGCDFGVCCLFVLVVGCLGFVLCVCLCFDVLLCLSFVMFVFCGCAFGVCCLFVLVVGCLGFCGCVSCV